MTAVPDSTAMSQPALQVNRQRLVGGLYRVISDGGFASASDNPLDITFAEGRYRREYPVRPVLDIINAVKNKIVDNAAALSGALQQEGLRIVSGGTDNHMMLIDLRSVGLTGAEGEDALERAGIATNKNMIPYDPNPPRVTSGVRVGTPAVTTRGMGRAEMVQIASWIGQVLRAPGDEAAVAAVRRQVRALCQRFPVPVLDASA